MCHFLLFGFYLFIFFKKAVTHQNLGTEMKEIHKDALKLMYNYLYQYDCNLHVHEVSSAVNVW